MPQTLAERLDAVEAAISRAEAHGESWTQGGRSESRSLSELYAERRRLLKEIDRDGRGGVRVRQIIPNG